jgi:hypothetical protein
MLLAVAALSSLLSTAPLDAKPSPALVGARAKFFGKANVDPVTGAVRSDRVILSWFGVSSYAAAFNGHVVLVDAWIPRGSHSGYVPTNPKEVAALDPEYIFIGHGDFDHAADAAQIAAESGAPIVGTPEHCDSIRGQAEDADIDCIAVAPEAASPGFTKQLDLIPGVDITSVVHIHSSFERPEQQDGGRLPCIPVWPVKDTVDHPPTPEDMQNLLEHLPDARGGNVLYQFRIGEFSLTWHDTTGKIAEDAPLALKAIKALPETDVHSGSVLAFGQVTNCFRSLRMYLDALAPKVYAANHHDNFTYFLGANAKDLEPYVREELARIPKKDRPELLYSYDRKDYLNYKLFTFDPNDPAWR